MIPILGNTPIGCLTNKPAAILALAANTVIAPKF
jgi:hypothetical protein